MVQKDKPKIGRLAVVLALLLLLAASASAAEKGLIYDWRVGRITSVTQDYGSDYKVLRLRIISGKQAVSVSMNVPDQCTLQPGTIVRFRIRRTARLSWLPTPVLEIDFYTADRASCQGGKGYKEALVGSKKKVEIGYRGGVDFIHESELVFPGDDEEALHRRWLELEVKAKSPKP